MIERRTVIVTSLVWLGAITLSHDAEPQQGPNVPRIAILGYGEPPPRPRDPLRQGLAALGYVEGETIMFEERYGRGKTERLDDFVAELLAKRPAVLVTYGPLPSVAAKRATSVVPIVFANANTPVEAGLVTSLARPGGNATGIAWTVGPDVTAKQLGLLKEAVPSLERPAFLYGSAGRESPAFRDAMEGAARQLGLKLYVVAVNVADEYDAAFRTLITERVDGIVIAGNARNFANRGRILDFASKRRLPTAFAWSQAVDDGGLLSYGADIAAATRRAAYYVDKILKGAKPSDLPVEQPTRFELVINMKTAKALGLTIPPSLLLRADQVIE